MKGPSGQSWLNLRPEVRGLVIKQVFSGGKPWISVKKGVFWFTDALSPAQLVELAQRTEELVPCSRSGYV
jgi:hypothetical protein